MDEDPELRIAFGPVGAAGLLLIVGAVVRRSLPLAILGGVAVWADATKPGLGGFAAARRR